MKTFKEFYLKKQEDLKRDKENYLNRLIGGLRERYPMLFSLEDLTFKVEQFSDEYFLIITGNYFVFPDIVVRNGIIHIKTTYWEPFYDEDDLLTTLVELTKEVK